MIPITKPWFPKSMRENITHDISEIISTGDLMLGKYTKLFENSYKHIAKSKEAISIASATSGLQIALRYAEVSGYEVLVPAASFITDVTAIQMEGANPILVDIDPATLTFDYKDLKNKISKKSRAIIWIHLTGYIGSEYKKIQAFAKDNGLFLIEDASHAHGAQIDGKAAGSLGDVGVFSFYPTKIMTTGSGGMLTTDNKEFAEFARSMRLFGKNFTTGETSLIGNDWFLDEFRCCIGYHQSLYLSDNLQRRRIIVHKYIKALETIKNVSTLELTLNNLPAWYQFPFFCDKTIDPNLIRKSLNENGISCKKIYVPIQEEKIFKSLLCQGKFNANQILESSVCLPLYVQLKEKDIEKIIKVLFQILI